MYDINKDGYINKEVSEHEMNTVEALKSKATPDPGKH